MNTAGLEWFGPPERNTLRLLFDVLPCLETVRECLCLSVLSCAASTALLYLKGGVYMAAGSPTGGPNDVVLNNVLFIHYGVAGEGDLSPGFPCLLLESAVQRVQTLSRRNGSRHS